MLHIGHASAQLIKSQFISRYPQPNLIPPAERPYFKALERDNQLMYAKAEALGWREPTKAGEEEYLQRIAHTRSAQQGD